MARKQKNKIEKMDEAKLLDYLHRSTQDARDYINTGMESDWGLAQKYYFGEKLGNEVEGKSQVISRDFSDAVDWMMPSLMEIFCGSKEVVVFDPQQPEDIELMEQASQYANYVFFRKNDGFNTMYTWMKDALMFKRGFCKCYWEEREEVVTEIYSGLDEMDVELLLTDADTQMIEKSLLEDGTMDVKISKVLRSSQIKIEPVPPEEFLIDRFAKTIKDATYTAHQRQVTMSDLRALGYGEDLIAQINNTSEDDAQTDELKLIREAFNGNFTSAFGYTDAEAGEANKKVWLVEAYVRIDYDGDGIAELRRIVYSGNVLLANDDWDLTPFCSLCPNPVQHIFYGQSVFDQVKDIQDIKTTLLRNQLDNMYLTNNGRHVVVEGQVNLQDLQNNKAGGIVREKMQNALRPLVQPPLPQGAYDMLGYMDELKTNRTGVSARSQGLDDKVLNSHTGQGQVNKVMSVAEQRLKLIARIFAETGVRDLFIMIYQLAHKYQQKEEVFKLNGQFVRVNPSKWNDRTDMEVVVGLGTNDKDQQLLHLSKMLELQQGIVQRGGMNILTNQNKIYNTLVELTENAGYNNPEKFWLDPSTPEGQQAIQQQIEAASKPKPEDIKAQADMMGAQVEQTLAQVDTQMKMKQQEADNQFKMMELQLEEREIALKEREAAIKESQQELENRKFEWEQQVNIAETILENKQQRASAIGDGQM